MYKCVYVYVYMHIYIHIINHNYIYIYIIMLYHNLQCDIEDQYFIIIVNKMISTCHVLQHMIYQFMYVYHDLQ